MSAVPVDMAVRALVPWFGGKRTLAPAIVAELGEHRAYWEPFCGSAAVLFAKPRSPFEGLNDLHGDLINLIRVVASDRSAELLDRCRRTLFAEPLYEELLAEAQASAGGVAPSIDGVQDAHLRRAWVYFATSWMGLNGVAGLDRDTFKMAIRWTPGGGSGGKRWHSATESIPAFCDRLRQVQVTQRDALELIPRISDEPGVVLYVDPPYVPETRTQHRYVHEFSDGNAMFGVAGHHEQLRAALGRFREARVVVSYYDHERVRELYAGWTFVAKTTNKNLKSQGGRGGGRAEDAPEVLILNGPSRAGGPG